MKHVFFTIILPILSVLGCGLYAAQAKNPLPITLSQVQIKTLEEQCADIVDTMNGIMVKNLWDIVFDYAPEQEEPVQVINIAPAISKHGDTDGEDEEQYAIAQLRWIEATKLKVSLFSPFGIKHGRLQSLIYGLDGKLKEAQLRRSALHMVGMPDEAPTASCSADGFDYHARVIGHQMHKAHDFYHTRSAEGATYIDIIKEPNGIKKAWQKKLLKQAPTKGAS